jgi:hypothetical protein
MDRVQLRLMAIKLRESGFSYREIMKELDEYHIPKSTISYWLRDITLDDNQVLFLKKRIVQNQKKGRFSTSIALRSRKVFKERVAFDEEEKDFKKNIHDSFFFWGISVYWAGGGKSGGYFQFVNSDPEMLRLMIIWIEKYLLLQKKDLKYRLFIKDSYKPENIEDFWANFLKIDQNLFQKTIYLIDKNQRKSPNYKGSLKVTITSIATLRKMLAWQKLLIKYYKETLLP